MKKHEKLNHLESMLFRIRSKLNTFSDQRLKELLLQHKAWFDSSNEFEKEYDTIFNSRKNTIINFIMESDPILTDNGLVAFINSNI